MTSEVSHSEETQLIKNEKEDDEPIEEKRCSSCLYFPKAVYFIITTELCERFNYYGMRTILILYLTQHLLLKEENAVSIYHLFVSLCYFTTIIGSFISDNFLGKYKTLIVICSLYTLGSTLMSVTAIPPANLAGPIISLLLISFGTGGVKACVGPFGGDQIPPTRRVVIDSFFSMFYFAINFGALLSTILTPILRADVACNGSDDCYPLAFGVPAMLMGVALAIFILGRSYYIDVPVRESIYMKALGCIVVAIKNWYRNRKDTPKKELLDYASGEYSLEFIQDLRTLSRIAILYLPLPIYWALYEQMGSRWTLQAAQLDGEIGGKFVVLPDQISILNVLLVMLFIPILDSIVYPICFKINKKLKPLRRMTLGITMTCISFLAAFILQLEIEARQPPALKPGNSRMYLVNTGVCSASIQLTDNGKAPIITAAPYDVSDRALELSGISQLVRVKMTKCKTPIDQTVTLRVENQQVNFLVIGIKPTTKQLTYHMLHDFHKPNRKGHPLVKLIARKNGVPSTLFRLKQAYTGETSLTFLLNRTSGDYLSTDWTRLVKPGRFIWSVRMEDSKKNMSKWISILRSRGDSLETQPLKIVSSSVSAYYVFTVSPESNPVLIPLPVNNGSTISIAWQIPQYIFISLGEVLVSITGLSFSYDQAPDGMKTLVNAFWYLSNACGNIIVMVVAKTQFFDKLSWQYLTFAMLCLVFNVLFAALGYYYRMRTNYDQQHYESMMEIKPDEEGVE